MAVLQPETDVPQMSGALSEDRTQAISRGVQAEPDLDHVYTERAGGRALNSGTGRGWYDDRSEFVVVEDVARRQQSVRRDSVARRSRRSRTTRKEKRPNRNSSLEDVLRLSSNEPPSGAPETRIPLPESRSASPSDAESQRSISRTSLDLIVEKGALEEDIVPDLPPSIPLPVSRNPSIRRERRRSTREVPPFRQDPLSITLPDHDYEAMIERASDLFSHLRHGRMLEETRHMLLQSNISHVDFPPSLYSSNMMAEVVDQSDADAYEFESLYKNIPLRVRQRVVIVQDLSQEIIQFLGSRYGVSPELFEEHLINSGYAGADYDNLPASTWPTAGMKKSHVSVKWHRPVHRLPVAPFSKQDLRDLLDPKFGRLEYTLHKTSDLGIFQTETNIFRSEWELWTDPSITPRKTRSCGWEERASIWTQQLPHGCRIVILLFDPLPTVEHGVERRIVETRAIEKNVRPDSNPSLTGTSISRDTDDSRSVDLEALDREDAVSVKERHQNQQPLNRFQRLVQRITQPQKPKGKGDGPAIEAQAVEVVEFKNFEKQGSLSVVKQTAPRGQVDIKMEDAFKDADKMELLRNKLFDTTSTKAEYCERISRVRDFSEETGFMMVMIPLFEIIRSDVMSLLKMIQNSLDEINKDILDDVKMEEALTMWRELITRSQFEIPELKRSLEGLFSFVEDINSTTPVNAGIGDEKDFRIEYAELQSELDAMLKRLKTAASSITQNMALLDSRRSISEAEGIAKLTELAFFFIPLTFASSLFGMEIEQLKDPAPLSLFVVIGIAFVAVSYLARLVIRSVWIRNLKHACNVSLKVYADRKHYTIQGGSVPASLFLAWCGFETAGILRASWHWVRDFVIRTITNIWKSMGFLTYAMFFVAIIITAPVAVLWTRPINRSTKGLITVLILFIVIPAVIITYWNSTSVAVRGEFIRFWWRIHRRVASGKSTIAKTIFGLCAIAVFVVPVAVLWTRPVSTGIKVGVTIAMCFIGIISATLAITPVISYRATRGIARL